MSEDVNVNAEAAKYRKHRNAYKAKATALETQMAELNDAKEAVDKQLAELKASIEQTPTREAARIAELEGQIRTRTHRDAFNAAAAGKIKPEALDAAWKLSDWKPDSDEVDAESLSQTIAGLVESHSFLAASDEATPEVDASSPPPGGLSRLSGPVPNQGRMPAVKDSKTAPPKIFKL